MQETSMEQQKVNKQQAVSYTHLLELQQLFAQMVEEGVETVVMEVSSQSLKLNRVAGCNFDIVLSLIHIYPISYMLPKIYHQQNHQSKKHLHQLSHQIKNLN